MMTSKLFNFTFKALGGSNELKIYAGTKKLAQEVKELVITEVGRIEEKFSRYQSESIISKINASAGKEPVQVDEETAGLLDYADACFKESNGLFDITSGVLRRVWDFKSNALPSADSVEEILPLIGWNFVEWDKPQIYLSQPGMEIDFGGIGKEYAVDRCAALLIKEGIKFGLINLGGDIHVVGPHADGSPWIVGIRHPRESGQVLAGVKVLRGALASSGDYERYMEIDGTRYSHILNPKSGWPVQDLQAVTVQAEACLVAGSIASITMLYGEKRGRRFLRDNQVPHLMVNRAGALSSFPKDLLDSSKQALGP